MIQTVLATLYQVFVPISIPVIVGILLKRYQKLDTKPLLTLALYFLSPALIFETLTKAEISLNDVSQTLLFCIFNFIVLWAAAVAVSKILGLSAPQLAGLTLVSTLTNSVNYGLPLVLLAFGQLGLDKASVYVIIQMILVNTVGIYLAARSQFAMKDAFKSVFRLPSIYAAAAAVLVRMLDFPIPATVDKGIAMVSGAYSPIVLCVLGAQMISVQGGELLRNVQKAFWAGIGIRLLLSPLLAAIILLALRIQGTLFAVLLILASMPAAVNAVILAEKFDASPNFVSKCILWTTLASFLLLPVLIVLVK
ncbi:AEC family transporter [Paenibacillus hamazuiensis]|uniref:AEC family transporter n=1 Tax=Paenibacillus hamazuiensis TaxID=2936508 RepID=UPI00200FB100|nr:AEC family transporter [Paenibacillus hamazuiensis]